MKQQKDFIIIENLELQAKVGAYVWEQSITRKLIFDIKLTTDIMPAARSDDLSQAIDYKVIIDDLIGFLSEKRFNLLESLAEDCAMQLLTHPLVEAIQLSVYKPGAVAQAGRVGVSITRAL